MTIREELYKAARLTARNVEWRAIADEVWGPKGFLFITKDPRVAEHLVRLHNIAIPASNLLTRALGRIIDLEKLLEIKSREQ